MRYKIKCEYDDEAAVWIATSRDVPGLVLEDESLDTLIRRVRDAVPELMQLNENGAPSYTLEYRSVRLLSVPAHG